MSQLYDFADSTGTVRLSGFINPDPAGKPGPPGPTPGQVQTPGAYYVNGRFGSDTNNGWSEYSPFQTIGAATKAVGNQRGCTIYLAAGNYVETVKLTLDQTALVALGGRGWGGSSSGVTIQAPAPAANCIEITADFCTVNGIGTIGAAGGVYTGSGIHIALANYCDITRWGHYGLTNSATPNTSNGGNGLWMEHGEGHSIYFANVSHAQRAFNLAEESSCGSFLGISTSTCWQDLYFNGVYTAGTGATAPSGGHTFVKWKAVLGQGGAST